MDHSGAARSSSSQIILKSILNPEQLKVQSLYEKCGVHIDAKTFLSLWQLCDLGIPAHAINALIHDIAKSNARK
jgi:hypothetical protein